MVSAIGPRQLFASPTIGNLLQAGDWAVAHAEPHILREAVRLLAPCVAVPQQVELEAIAHLATSDLRVATTRWIRVSQHLRDHLFHVDGYVPASA